MQLEEISTTSTPSKLVSEIKRVLSTRFLRFIFVGGVNTLIDLGTFNLVLFLLVLHSFETELAIAKVSGFFIASLNSYILNARFTFKKGFHKGDSKLSVLKRYALFISVSLIGVCINIAVMFLFYKVLITSVPVHKVLVANMATLGATGISLIWNFLAYRKFVFK